MSNQSLNAKTTRTERISSWQQPVLIAVLLAVFAILGGLILAFGGPLAAIALVLAIVAGFVVLRDINIGFWGIIAVICLLPFATIPVDIGLTPTFLDLALAAFVGVWLLRLVTGRQREIVTSPVTLPLVIFLIIAIFAFIFGLQNGPFTPTLARKFAELLLSIGLVIVIVDYCRTWETLETGIKIILLGGAAASLIAIGLWILPDDTANTILNLFTRVGYPGGWVIRYIEENPALSERAIGTSIDPNAFGGVLVLIGALAVPQFFAKEPLFRRSVTWLILGLIFVALLLTFSRGAFLALAAGVAFLALARYRKLFVYGAIVLVLIMILPWTQEYVVRLVQGLNFFNFSQTDLASQMRLGEFRDAWSLIQRYPLFGVGFAGSPDIDLYLGVANVYLSIGQQMGLLGLVSFLSIFVTLFGDAWLKRRKIAGNERVEPIWLGLLATLVAGLAAGLFDHYLFNTEFHHTVTMFWMMVGLTAAATRLGSLMDADSAETDSP
jgi:O-antigen ligase